MGRARIKPDNEKLRDFLANVGPMDERRADAIIEREKAKIRAKHLEETRDKPSDSD